MRRMTIEECAEMKKMNKEVLRRHCRVGKLTSVKENGRRWIVVDDKFWAIKPTRTSLAYLDWLRGNGQSEKITVDVLFLLLDAISTYDIVKLQELDAQYNIIRICDEVRLAIKLKEIMGEANK